MTGDVSIYNILSHYQAPIWNQSWIHSSTVALNYKMFAWGLRVLQSINHRRRYVLGNFSKTVHNCLRNVLWRGSKPNLNPLLMYNTSVWHSWVSARPFKATLIFFYLQSCKSEEGKGRREVTHSDSAVADFVPVDLQCSAVPPKSRRSWGEPWCSSSTYFSYSALSGQGQRSRIQHANGKSRKIHFNAFKICIKCINK